MAWIWQHKEWPEFRFNANKLVDFEQKFLDKAGMLYGAMLRITGAPRATTTRDLQDLTAKGALVKTGELRYIRYHINLK